MYLEIGDNHGVADLFGQLGRKEIIPSRLCEILGCGWSLPVLLARAALQLQLLLLSLT